MTKIYTASYGQVTEATLVNETPKGYRVTGGRVSWSHIVFKLKQFAGWVTGAERDYYQERSFTSNKKAVAFANHQILCMEQFYKAKLERIEKLKLQLNG